MTQQKIALVVGANGALGSELGAALARHGWRVRGLVRKMPAAAAEPGASIEWIVGDAMHTGDVKRAAAGAALLVHAVNPPGYRDWDRLSPPMLQNSIAAARDGGARIVLPGNVYNYDPQAFPVIDESAPQEPLTRKGAIRVRMEQALRRAGDEGVRSLIVRAGDFFGPHASASSWFAQGLVKPGHAVKAVTYPGTPGTGHAWAYLPDFAEAIAQLLDDEGRLGVFETFHFAGHWDADGTAMVGAIRKALQQPRLPLRRFPWYAVTLLAPFVTLFRELREMRYLWRQSLRLDNRRLVDWLGAEPHTPLDLAVRRTLDGLVGL